MWGALCEGGVGVAGDVSGEIRVQKTYEFHPVAYARFESLI